MKEFDTDPNSTIQVPSHSAGKAPAWKPKPIYDSETPVRNVSYEEQCPGSTVSNDDASFMDDVAQYRQGGIPMSPHKKELLRVLNQAMDSKPNSDTSLVGRQDSDPKGG